MVYLGLPIKNGDFPWRTVSHNQMVNLSMAIAVNDITRANLWDSTGSSKKRKGSELPKLVNIEKTIENGDL